MIVDVYNNNKRKGRKKKIVVDVKKSIDIPDEINSPVVSKTNRNRINKYGIIGYRKIVDIFSNIIKSGNIPNLTIYGKSGSGKTYIVDWLLLKLFKNNYKERVLTLSLNDERGISIIRDKIKSFSNIQVKEYKDIPSLKVIVFEQAEYLSTDAQNALRRIIELSGNVTRFIFITKNTRCIIDPILSRCLKLHLSSECQLERIEQYMQLFPEIPQANVEKICENNNFGIEINLLENHHLYEEPKKNNTEQIAILLNKKQSKLTELLQYCSNIVDFNELYLLVKRELPTEKIGLISNYFLKYEIKLQSFSKMHLLNFLCNLHNIIHN